MTRPFRSSPCCRVRSHVHFISLEQRTFTLCCSACGQVRQEPMREEEASPEALPRLRLIVDNTGDGDGDAA